MPRWGRFVVGASAVSIAVAASTRLAYGQSAARVDSRAISGGVAHAAAPVDRRPDVRLCAGGDVTLGTNLDTAWSRRNAVATGDATGAFHTPEALVGPLRPLMRGADIVIVNVEGAIGDGPVTDPKCDLTRNTCYLLRSPSEAARAIRHLADSGSIVVANVANNHLHDAGAAGVAATLAALDSAGVLVTGADTVPTVAVTARGDTVAVLGFSVWSVPSVNDLEAVRRLVANAVDHYGRVVVTAHVGAEGRAAQRTPNAVERYVGEDRGNSVAFAHAAVEAGATVVIGHGPHVLRAIEWWNSALILYSMGNLINYGPFGMAPPMNRGAVVCATLDSAGLPRDVVLRSTRQPMPGTVLADSTNRARALVDSLSRLDFPATGARVDRGSGAILERGPVAPSTERGAVSPRRLARPAVPDSAPPSSNPPPSRASPAGPPATP
jgi:hypothetical protein